MTKRKVEPANSLTYNSQIIEFSMVLSDDATEVHGILMLKINGVLTEEMEFVGNAVGTHWHMSRKDPTQKFCEWDGNVNTKAIRFLINRANVAVLERERPIRYVRKEMEEVAA